jgi:hypothetical protein
VKVIKLPAALSDVSELDRKFAIAQRAGFRPKEENFMTRRTTSWTAVQLWSWLPWFCF